MMKKLIYPFFLLFILSCDRPVRPVLHPGPNPDNLAKQQAPFGDVAVDVKLKKVSEANRLSVEYFYEGDQLTEQRRYDDTNYITEYQIGKYIRKDQLPIAYQVDKAFFDAQSNGPTSYIPNYVITYEPPRNDSIRQIKRRDANVPDNRWQTYAFDKEGFIVRRQDWYDQKANISYNYYFVRDSRHNVKKLMEAGTGEPMHEDWIEYVYDDHPNPFFKLGRDWSGEIWIHSLSPNNVVKEIRRTSSQTLSSITYTYEYLPNGYPNSVTISIDTPTETPYTFKRVFEYQ